MTYTIIFYNLILLLSTLFVWLSTKSKAVLVGRFFVFIAFLMVSLSVGLRYELGVDYISYTRIFERSEYDYVPWVEIGFNYFISLIHMVGGTDLLFLSISFVTYCFLFSALPRRNKAFFFYLSFMVFYFQSFNIIRAMLALSVVLYAFMVFYQRGKVRQYFPWILIAATFHKSVFVYLIFPFLKKLIYINRLIPISIFTLCVVLFLMSNNSLSTFFNNEITRFFGYESYLSGKYFVEPDGSGFAVIARTLFLVYVLFYAKQLIGDNPNNIYVVIIISLCCLASILSLKIVIFKRFEDILSIAYILAPWVLVGQKKVFLKKTILIIFVFYQFVIFNTTILTGNVGSCTGAVVTPYTSIFNKEDSNRINRASNCKVKDDD